MTRAQIHALRSSADALRAEAESVRTRFCSCCGFLLPHAHFSLFFLV
jgi:hypothetical protein